MRLSVTATTGDATWALTEIRAFKKKTTVGTGLDFFGIMGDSITADDLSKTGDIGLYQVLRTLKNDGSQPVTYVMGLAAQATYLLSDAAATEQPGRSLARALELTPDIRYFGIAFGTNDAAFDSNLVSMRQNLTEGLTRLLAAGKVPIVARMPDTDTANGGFGSLPNKKTALQNIDELVAQYKLVPGPDFYTFFRQNYAFLRDGTHHTIEGMTAENRIWAEAIFRSGIYGTAVDTTRPAAPTNLRRAP
jgi:lysophospholipase L1-like esterase